MTGASPDFRHSTPEKLQEVLDGDPLLSSKWHDLTPLARNEWVCWMTSPKKQETRDAHLARLREDVLSGKKRPCCWPGCPHRRASAGKYFKG
jgi:uncharacterized protein YdeI (YjbR/CyaY-like superfamily)